ncbi:hypothetical protein EBT16_05820, partial [bacterium]|nr:hypothetical protein [bacterium]
GIFNFSGSFISGTSAISVDARTPNFIDGDVRNVLSMVTAQNNLYISSRAGLYQINLSQIQNPQTSLALPYGAPNLFGTFGGYTSSIPQFSEASKEQFRWDSMVYVSQLNQIWGFRGNRMSRLNLGGLSYDPRPQVATNFQLDTSCDPAFKRSSAVFQGKVYVAACSRVLVLNPNSTGNITSESFRYQLNAVQVVATQNRLYVHHEPSYSWGRYSSSTPEGIYVFDAGLNYINYVPIQPISFAVSPDDQYLFANEDNYDVGVYAISQGGRLGTLAR